MSEAANRNMQSTSPSDVPPLRAEMSGFPPDQSPSHSQSDEWETMNFPGAMRVDDIPHSAVSVDLSAADLTRIVQQLRQENAHLKQQVTHLEQDLTQTQVELQLEMARSLYQVPEAAAEDETIRQQVHLLTDELERSRQTGQGQQILIDTLKEQLNSSHERVAQLERECSALQQHYTEQVQLVMQSDSACRDLRKRLHRQQQQTLQLKAALEKCLEMPHLQGRMTMQDLQLPQPTAIDSSRLVSPTAQPVQPWSTAPETSQGRFYTAFGDQSTGLPHSLADLLGEDAEFAPIPSDEMAMPQPELAMPQPSPMPENLQSDLSLAELAPESDGAAPNPSNQTATNVLELIFPSARSEAVSDVPPVSAQEKIFDLSPFLEAGETPIAPAPAMATDVPELPKPAATVNSGMEDVWAELNPFLDPANAALQAMIPPSFNLSEPMTAPYAHTAIGDPQSMSVAQPTEADGLRETLPPQELSVEQEIVDPSLAPPAMLDEFGSAPANWPSPTLYPFRSPQKKRQSLASVELPSFPQA